MRVARAFQLQHVRWHVRHVRAERICGFDQSAQVRGLLWGLGPISKLDLGPVRHDGEVISDKHEAATPCSQVRSRRRPIRCCNPPPRSWTGETLRDGCT